ncbi:NAT_SF domain containing protein [uncultured Caudovirales phage]|uniref:NAT_SF domain containing protein n=1 Tax=uncultured Caudovirales phage TaxID=2100421 RepID=A0A6J5R0Z9_9CAUD|nr:NAT_SF domain containing protein [uncultured Caudovirales phage]
MAELYAKPFETIDTGYNPQQPQGGGQSNEADEYLSSLPPEERQAAIQRLNAPLTGEELATLAQSGQKQPSLAEFAEIEKFHKNHEISFIDGLGKIAEGGEQFMSDISKAFGAMLDKPTDVASKMPATAVEAFAQGTRNFYGMLAQSSNTDSTLFKVKDFLNGTGTIEDRYNQYIQALKFNKDSAELAEGKQTMVMDADMINHEVTQAMAYIADPTLFIPFGKVASTGLRAVGLGEKLAMAGARSAAIKNGIIGNTLKWGVGQPLEFLGGAVRNTIDYGLDKAGAAFEATTGVGAKEFAQTARMSGIGFSASAVAGHAVPYASTISDAYIVGSSAKGFGEAVTLLGDTMKKNKFGRGINSWAAEALEQAEKNGTVLSPHAKGLLKTLNAVDPLFAYGWNGLETAGEGALIGGGLGYLSGGQEGMYSGIGAGIAMGAVGGTAGKMVADVTGGTNVARRAVQAKMVIEGHKVTNPDKAMFFQAMQTTAEARGQDVDLVNGIIAGIDKVAPNFEFHALTPEQFAVEAIRKGYDPNTGKFMEISALDSEFGGDRASKSKAIGILRSVGGDFVGNRQGFLDALKKASAKDSANPNKPASNIPLALRKYTDVAKTFEKLTKTQQEAVLKEIDGQGAVAKELGGATRLRDHYDTLTWAEGWTDQLVKKFETDREGSRKDITEMLAQETGKDGKLNRKGRALADKLRAEGFLDRDNKLLRERNLLQADLTLSQFAFSKGAVIGRESDGKTHMYINLNSMGNETFPHELFHTIMRESPMKKYFTDSLISKLLGTVDKDGKLSRPAEVNIGQVQKFFKKYIDLTHRNSDGTLDAQASEAKFKLVQEALAEYQNAGTNKQISDKARGLLENYSEEFGAYYFSHWLMGRNRNTLFFGGELKGIEGLVERTKDSFKDFWQSKISKSNPEFDFSKGLNESFDRSKGLGRIASVDYYMRDMVRAAANANREAFRPDAMTLDNLKDFERSNGIRNLTTVDGNRRLNPREQVTQNIRLGKEAFKILSGVDKAMRTSKDVVDENGKQVITGRLSETELDALVKGGIVPRAWADKVNQGYAMLDGTISNIFSAGYLGKTEQTTDASYPRLTGKDVAFKNRKAVLFDVETKVKADGTFYTLFHTLDLAVIEQEANRLFQNTDYRALFDGDRAVMEADFFRYLSNASRASTDPKKLDSAALLEKGDGLGAQRRDVLHQMGRMALQTGDAYKHQPIAVIPEGFRHSVTTFNIDGMTMPRIETGTRIDIDMKNAHKFIRENWQPDEMKQEKTPSGVLMTHESGFKFSNINGKTTAYTSAGRKIGTFDNIKSATNAAKSEFKKVYDSLDRDVEKEVVRQNQEITKFQPLDENERNLAFGFGDLFAVPSVKAFVGDRLLLRQTREEHIFQRALEAIENPEKLYDYALKAFEKEKGIFDEMSRLENEYDKLLNSYKKQLESIESEFNRYVDSLRPTNLPKEMFRFEDWLKTKLEFDEQKKTIKNQSTIGLPAGFYTLESYLIKNDESRYWDLKTQFDLESNDAKYGYVKTEAYRSQERLFEAKKESIEKTVGDQVDAYLDKLNKFREQNKIVLSHEGLKSAFETLEEFSYNSESGTGNTSKAEQGKMLASLVKANVNAKDYSGLLEKLFSADYDDKIQTGVPFVAVTTHGTKSVRLMLTRLFEEGKLGTTFTWAESSKLGQFSAGSQKTSGSSDYQTSKRPISLSPEQYKVAVSKIDAFNRELINLYADALIAEQKERYGYEGWFTGVTNINGDEITLTRNELVDRLIQHNKDKLAKGLDELVIKTIGARRMFDGQEAWSFGLEGGNEGLNTGMAEVKNPELVKKINDYNDRLFALRTGYGLDNVVTSRMALEGKSLPPPVKMQTRQLIRMDNPYVVVDPRSYEEKNLSSHMKKAISLGHDGVVFKFLADGGDKDTVFAVFSEHIKKNIKVTETSFDSVNLPRGSDETGRKLLGGKDLKLHFQPTDESEAPKQIQGIKLDMTKAYDVFRQEYEQSTGQSWSMDKFMQRASNWQFFGDENGFVAVRPQRSGFVKLVGMAGDNKSKLRGIQQIQQMGLPVWGMVSKDIKDIAVKRGMREPNMIERTLLKQALNSAALGDAEILGYTSDNGVRLRYPDIGEVTKYMIGSPEYYQKLRSAFGEQVKNKIGFQPDEVSQGGRKYDPASKEFRTKFIGKWAEENPDRIKGYDLEFIDRGTKYGTHNVRIRLQDNSVKGKTEDVGHITADIDPKTKVASLSSNIGVKYRGNKLSYALYSEMAERLRSMGIEKVDGTIVNPEGIPIKVREKIIGNTRVLRSDGSSGLPIDYKQGSRIIQKRQAESGNTWGGLDVVNELDFNARYQPAEGEQGEPIRLSGKKKTISTKKVSTNEYEMGEGDRTYNTDSRQWTNGFIGRYAEENPILTKGIKLSMKNWDKRTDDYGKRSIELKEGNKLIGRIDYEVKRGSGGKWLLSDPTVRVWEQYRGKGYSNLLYSEMAERARFLGAEDFLQRIENDQALPMFSQVKTFGFGESKLIDADRGKYFPPTKENFDKLKNPSIDIQKQDGSIETVKGYEPWVHSWSKIFSDRHYMPAELIQHGFEKSDLNEKLLKSGHIVLGFDERSLAGKAVVINNPDMMMTGELKTREGKTLVEGEGGLNFVSKFADIWANSIQSKAETTASKLRKAQDENGGVAYLALSRGELTKSLNSHTGSKAGMSILEYFVDQGYISLEEFRNALKDSGRKYGIEFNATQSAKAIHAEIAQKFFGVADSSFEARGSFVEDVITHLAQNGESGHKNIDKIRTALGSERLGRKISFASKGIREAIGLMISDKRANVDPSHIYAYIEVTGNISVEKTENGHKSYPYHIVQRDENGNKIRPKMLIPDKTNYVTDVMLDSNKEEVPRTITDKSGRPMSGAVKLGSNQVGEAYGYVKSAEKIPEGKQRLAWQPAEFTEFKSEQSPTGRILRNARGYVIMLVNNKFRVYNPAKAIIGVYGNEEEAKKRIYKEIPKR